MMDERQLLAAHGMSEAEADARLRAELPSVDVTVRGQRELERIRRQLARQCPCHAHEAGEDLAAALEPEHAR